MTANFSSSGLAFFILTILFIVICGGVIALRFVAIRISHRRFFVDDGFVLFAYANVIALGGVGMWSCVNGLGKSATVLSPYEIAAAAKLLFTAYICWLLASVFYKLAILSLYNRIFTTMQFRRWSHGLSALIVAYCIGYFCVYMTNCVPIDYMWNPTPGGKCRDGQVSDYSTLGINMFLDLAILVLPLPTLWSLKLPTRKKITVTVMLSFGFLTIAVMIWRIIWTERYRANPDFTTYLSKIGIVSGFELWLGIIVACIPTLAPLFRVGRFADGSTTNSSSGFTSSKQAQSSTRTYQRSRIQGDEYSRITDRGSQEGFALEALRSLNEESLPASGNSHVQAECTFDPESVEHGPPMKPDAIYVRTNIQV